MVAATKKPKTPATEETVDLTDALTPQEVASILKVKVKTLSSWRSNMTPNRPPFVPITPRVVLYPRAEFYAWLNRQKMVRPDSI